MGRWLTLRRNPKGRLTVGVENGEQRAVQFSEPTLPRWSQVGGGYVSSGVFATENDVYGLPAVGQAVRLVAATIAQLPLKTWTGELADKKVAKNEWQYALLRQHPLPIYEGSAYDFMSDLVSAVEWQGNYLARKARNLIRADRRVEAFIPFEGAHIRRDPQTQEKIIEVFHGGKWDRVPLSEVFHVRGYTYRAGGVYGLSTVEAYREKLGYAIARDEYQGRFFSNDATPGFGISFPGRATAQQEEEWLARWDAEHRGLANAHRPVLFHSGSQPVSLPQPTLHDSELVDSQRFTVEDTARIFGLPASLLSTNADLTPNIEQDTLRYLVFHMQPRLIRIQDAFAADPDLFPNPEPYPEFDTKNLLRTDVKTKAEALHLMVQDGTLTPDEARAELGYPPHPDGIGAVPQMTPVGGAPNPNLQPTVPQPQPAPNGNAATKSPA